MTLPELPTFNLHTARQYSEAGRLADWLHTYLNTGRWANKALSDGLKLQTRWWVGPIELPLADLERVCGPEANMEFRVDAAGWEKYVALLMNSFSALENYPPLIVHYHEGRMTIRDGNHRYEAFHRLKLQSCYVFIWFDSPAMHSGSRFAGCIPLIT